ncbi:1-aminocyclopropane-1-carboxylate synthase 11 [Nannizzia gypsea CBS 118893]|uniref:1-aminocyclopropane-1-carboxylate synthase 11 n=1 Tax=Arthroderma gypseum (strain ATCC MYA-4604 / CBS 118893) TaxID=535722 RepID=E4URD6_ARTGP|nr:1-aminocyclopropane-1-carboxylate synthase 11 [Nannizzia gypsea CBS 118893]EFR00199.1 1-aminocyclopropane-1-carboxylate synthase 11 [Nannizzia gypsea CBS 118893]
MLSNRGKQITAVIDEPWRALWGKSEYDAKSNPSGLISLNTAENPLAFEELTTYINGKIQFENSVWSYSSSAGGGPKFPDAMAAFVNRYFDPYVPVKSSEIFATNSIPSLSEQLAFTLAEAGDGMLVSRPVYGRFRVDWGSRAGVKIIYADTGALEGFTPAGVKKYEEAIIAAEARGVKIRGIIIVNPHNPLGRCYPRETLVEIFKLCQKYQIHLISDEIYALSVFDSGESGAMPFVSTLSINAKGLMDENLLHVIYGMSKDFSAPGLRVGCLISKNPLLVKVIRSTARQNNPSGISLDISATILNDEKFVATYLENTQKRVLTAYRFVTGLLQKHDIPYLPGTNAGCFIWLDLSKYLPPSTPSQPLTQKDKEFALAKQFSEGGLFLHPSEENGMEPGWFRLVYTREEELITEGIRRLKRILNSLPWVTTRVEGVKL